MAASGSRVRAYHGDEPFVFISYAHADEVAIHLELQSLDRAGFRVYYDEGIHPGHAWHEDLANAIDNCSLFLLYVTAASVASRNCARELNYALAKDKPVVAVHLEEMELPAGFHLALGDRQAIHRQKFDEAEYRERLVDAVGDYLAPRPSSEPVDLASDNFEPTDAGKSPPPGMRSKSFIAAALVVLLAVGAYFLIDVPQAPKTDSTSDEIASDERAAFENMLVEVEALLAKDRYGEAFVAARPFAETNDPRWPSLWNRIIEPSTPNVGADNVAVWYRPYGMAREPWTLAGTSPFTEAVPLPRGVLELRLERTGDRPTYFAARNPGPVFSAGRNIAITPIREGEVADDMVIVPAMEVPIFLIGWARSSAASETSRAVPRFAISKYEVTNAEFKAFVDAGGYSNPAYWRGFTYLDLDQTLSEGEAMARFVDRTGRPGPAGWELSTYPDGEGDLPVGGISWYEAVAYSRFAGKSLPTIQHWGRAAFGPAEGFAPLAPSMLLTSNFQSEGPVPADTQIGMGPWGTFQTAGNVREWVWNAAGNEGLALGGSWSGYAGNYQQAYTLSRMNRGPDLGFRVMQSLGNEPVDPALLAPLTLVRENELTQREPMSDEAFEALRFQFTASSQLPSRVNVEVVEETGLYRAEKHTLTYPGEKVQTLFIIKPIGIKPVAQAMVYGPPGNSVLPSPNSNAVLHAQFVDYVVRGGRVLIVPIWTGTYERAPTTPPQSSEELAQWQRDGAFSWHQDIVDVMNYAGTIDDIDENKVGYIAISYGAGIYGQLLMALEPRLRVGVFISGGLLHTQRLHPALDAINYVPRITQPMLMLNGRFDHLFLVDASQRRMFDLLGTPEADKKHVLFDTGHFQFPRNQVVAEVSDWLDAYLGEVR